MNPNLFKSLFLEGAVIKVNISIWSGRKKLDPSDIGFSNDMINEDLISLGSKWVIKKEDIQELEQIRAKANNTISSRSMDFSFGRFIKNTDVESIKMDLGKMRDEFFTKVREIGSRYEETVHELKNMWQVEAGAIAAKTGRPELVFEVMDKIESCFRSWEWIEPRFTFDINEYRDINKVAEEFVMSATYDMIDKVREFASKVKEKLDNYDLTNRNLKPIQSFIATAKEQASIFHNDQLQSILDELDEYTSMDSVDLNGVPEMREKAIKAMSALADRIGDEADSLQRESVATLTKHARSIDLE